VVVVVSAVVVVNVVVVVVSAVVVVNVVVVTVKKKNYFVSLGYTLVFFLVLK